MHFKKCITHSMITVTDTFESARFYDLEHELNKKYENKKAAYFDIETTGFSSKSQQIYLIGAAYKNEDSDTFTVIQWFDDTSHDECKLLLMFREFLKDFDILVDYNGNSFDIPFIKNRGIKHGILFNFDKFVLIDLYLEIKKYRGFFKTPDLKQKSIELFLNINREDEYDGGRLIEIYKDYIKEPSKSKDLLSLLMLHNHDDIIGLVNICDILAYPKLLAGCFTIEQLTFEHMQIRLKCKLNFNLKSPVFERNYGISFEAHDNTLTILIPIENRELKYFYDNYKEYYYLPGEDMAIHKSVAQFVDKNHRIKATKENCYIKKAGMFAIQLSEIFKPAFQQKYNDKIFYFEINETDASSVPHKDWQIYITDILNRISLS